MYEPKFTYSQRLVNTLCEIAVYCGKLSEIKLASGANRELREDTRIGIITDLCRIDGGKITFEQVKDVLFGRPVQISDRVKRDIHNCKDTVELVDKLMDYSAGLLSDGDLKWMNQTLLNNVPKSEWHIGKYRKIQNWVLDSRKEEIVFTPPSPELVDDMMKDFTAWLRHENTQKIHPVVRAGIAHYHMMYIHPFVYENEKIAMLLSVFILKCNAFIPYSWVRFTEFFVDNPGRYYQALISGIKKTHKKENDLTSWLEYFADNIKSSMETVRNNLHELSQSAEKHADLQISSVRKGTAEIESRPAGGAEDAKLNQRQALIMKFAAEKDFFQRKDIIDEFAFAEKFNPKTISRDLTFLVEQGFLNIEGERKGTRYSLKRRPAR